MCFAIRLCLSGFKFVQSFLILKMFMCEGQYLIFTFQFQVREKYKLGDPKSFHYLNQSKCYELDGVDDAHEYLATRRAMDIVGISEEEQVCLLRSFWKNVFLYSYFMVECQSQHHLKKLNIWQNRSSWKYTCPLRYIVKVRNNFFQEAIFRVVAAILHLGNIEFAKGKEIDSSVIKDEKSKMHLNMTAELLR